MFRELALRFLTTLGLWLRFQFALGLLTVCCRDVGFDLSEDGVQDFLLSEANDDGVAEVQAQAVLLKK